MKGRGLCCKIIIFVFFVLQTAAKISGPTAYSILQGKMISENFTINQLGCRIPKMYLNNSQIRKYLKEEKKPKCEPKAEFLLGLVKDNDTSIMIDSSRYDIQLVNKNMDCRYTPFGRKYQDSSTGPSYDDFKTQFFNYSVKFKERATMKENEDFVRVTCNLKDAQNALLHYEDYFAFTPIKTNIEKRCERIKKRKDKENGKRKTVNILIIGIDSMSRLNFHRQLRKTSKFLESLDAIEMHGYNKVGDNTFPNLIPVLTGKNLSEIESGCWKGNPHFDNCTFIWDTYSRMGYRTALAEDCSIIGTFNYNKKNGFNKQPTDYYYRPFDVKASEAIGNIGEGYSKLCFGDRYSFEIFWNYVRKFVTAMNGKDYFGFFWSNILSHDYLNRPQITDDSLHEIFSNFKKNNQLENTVLILMSDHGLRFGDFRQTYQGHLEDCLPLLAFVFPKWFQKEYSEAFGNIRRNIKRLTTPFDLHETLVDLSNLNSIKNGKVNKRNKRIKKLGNAAGPRGISLFLNANTDRNCSTASIPLNYCTCRDSITNLETQDKLALRIGTALVSNINSLIKHCSQCSKLELKKVRNLIKVQSQNTTKLESSNYEVIVETIPGGGVFEGSLKYDKSKNTYKTIGTVGRVNTYKNQCSCPRKSNSRDLMMYCHCL